MSDNKMILTLSDLAAPEPCTAKNCAGDAKHRLEVFAPEFDGDPEASQLHALCSMHLFSIVSGAAFLFAELAEDGLLAGEDS
jgi:hypothetical protein